MAIDVFDAHADEYDAWYDSEAGRAAFAAELETIAPLLEGAARPWLEVGVGSGRFAGALGVEFGVDPAPAPLRLAARRGVGVAAARAEGLPFLEGSFGAVLFVVSLLFVADPREALREARRVLKPGGRIMLAEMPAEGPLGQEYLQMAAAGDPFYSRAHFFSREELRDVLGSAGFQVVRTRSSMFGTASDGEHRVCEGDDLGAGFVALQAQVRSTSSQSDLLLRLDQTLPARVQTRFNELIARRRAETLTAGEHQELLALTDTIENVEAQRIKYLGELAGLRQVSLPELLEQLGRST